MESLAELERVQTRILQRITDLELSLSSAAATTTTTESRLSAILLSNGVKDFSFKRVASDYYDWPLEARRDVVGAASIDHLCKSIVLVNTQAPSNVTDCSDRNNSKYYVVVVQYSARFNAESVKNFLYTLNNGKIPKKKINRFKREVPKCLENVKDVVMAVCSALVPIPERRIWAERKGQICITIRLWNFKLLQPVVRLAPEETSARLTGYVHNAVTCIGLKTDIPVILDEAIVKLNPDFFWLGGGEVDLKLGIRTSEFINIVKPFIVNCSNS